MIKGKSTILYIEDDKEVSELVIQNLEDNDFNVIWLQSGSHFDLYLDDVELVVLDIMLPGLDGFTVGQRIKERNPHLPILFLTARTAIEDRLKGLQFADDYLTKPFHPDELLLRMDKLLKRSGVLQETKQSLGHLDIDVEANQIFNRETGEEVILTEKQFKIFHYLLNHSNQILTKEQIYASVWGQPFVEGDKTLHVHIRYLRQKVEKDPQNPTIIETIRGLGYRVRQ